MLVIQDIAYFHPNKDLLFEHLNFSIPKHAKAALIGNNGVGKSTLLKIIAGVLPPSNGIVQTDALPYYVPQIFGQFNDLTIAQALHIEAPLKALRAILGGTVSNENMMILDDDWTLEERCQQAMEYWQLSGLDLDQKMSMLSGGQKTKVFLAGISIHQPKVILLDEPSNHLDHAGRALLYEFIQHCKQTLMVVSHDRTLLNLLDTVYELSKRGISVYGGNYDFYAAQKQLDSLAFEQDLRDTEKALRKAKDIARETAERQNKLDARGKKKQEKAGLPTISMNTLRNNAEKSTGKIKGVHAEKVSVIAQELSDLREALPATDQMRFGFDGGNLHKGKILFHATDINYCYNHHELWNTPLNVQIVSGERIAVTGRNGSGKTTLIRLILGELAPTSGKVFRADQNAVYIDQDYSLIDPCLKVYEQAQRFNVTGLQEHEVKIRLNRFLFKKEDWEKPCSALSGGEKMKLMLCCITIGNQAPDLIVLDEPTNNLDLQNMDILTAAINDYQGTLLVITHDEYFLKQVEVTRFIHLD